MNKISLECVRNANVDYILLRCSEGEETGPYVGLSHFLPLLRNPVVKDL